MLGELTDIQIKNILSSQMIGRLACTDGKKPYVVPITYAFDGNCIYGQTNEGMKLNILRKNPNACFEVDIMTDMRNWESVVVSGKFEELKDEKARMARELLFSKVYPLMTSSTIHTHEHKVNGLIDDSTRVKYVMYRIKITRISGRFEKQ